MSETVKVTLWWNESLREEGVGTETKPCGSVWDIRGNMRGAWGEEVVVRILRKTVKMVIIRGGRWRRRILEAMLFVLCVLICFTLNWGERERLRVCVL